MSIVEGNAGPDIDKKVREDLVNLRTIHMEYDMFSVSTNPHLFRLCVVIFRCSMFHV